jgi:hypothetical protein
LSAPAARSRVVVVLLGIAVLAVAWLVLTWPDARPAFHDLPIAPTLAEGNADAAKDATADATATVAAVANASDDASPSTVTRDGARSRASAVVVGKRVRGRVDFADGSPAASARVRAGERSTRADASGLFTLDVSDPDQALAAWLPTYQPAVVATVLHHPDVVADRQLVLVLPGPALTIEGRVTTSDGAPAQGWWLHVHSGGTVIEPGQLPALTAEDFAHGAAPGVSSPPLHARQYNPNLQMLGEGGTFTFGGLRSGHEYVLRAWHDETLQSATTLPIRAGTRGYNFVLPPADWRPPVTGRVVNSRGEGVAGVAVHVQTSLHRNVVRSSFNPGPMVTTDAQGRFTLERVLRDDVEIRYLGNGMLDGTWQLRANDPGQDLVLRIATWCKFRFEPLPQQPPPTSLRVLDAQLQPMSFQRLAPNERGGDNRHAWPGGDPAHEFAVSDAAAWLVLEVDVKEVRRVPLRVSGGATTIVRG